MTTEDAIRQTQQLVSKYCWDHDFNQFCARTGWTGIYAHDKWHELQALNAALAAFDAVTLAKIVGPAQEQPE